MKKILYVILATIFLFLSFGQDVVATVCTAADQACTTTDGKPGTCQYTGQLYSYSCVATGSGTPSGANPNANTNPSNGATAAERPLEITYPNLPNNNITPPTNVKTPLPEYVRYIYYLIVGLGGLFALGALLYGGFRYITSMGNPEATKDAKDQILAAVIGLLILLGSYILLNSINPELIALRVAPLKPVIPPQFSGVLLCGTPTDVAGYYNKRKQAEGLADQFSSSTDEATQNSLKSQIDQIGQNLDKIYAEIKKNCYLVPGRGNLPDEWSGKITKKGGMVYIIADEYTITEGNQTKKITQGYGVILTDVGVTYDVNQWLQLSNPSNPGVYSSSVKIDKINSTIPYLWLKDSDVQSRNVIVYEEVNYNRLVEEKASTTYNASANWTSLKFSPRSLIIGAEDKTIVALTTGESGEAGIMKNGYFFTKSDPDLLKYYWITDKLKCPIEAIRRGGCPAAKWIAIGYGQIY